jgi:crossover junction endodeoxyribonuclease RuvC
MIILGIDPALRFTGYGVIEYDPRSRVSKSKVILLEAGIISTSAKQLMPERLNKIHEAVNKLITDARPDVIVLEKIYAHYRHPTTSYILGQARGVICLLSAKQGIPLVEYAATRVKKAIVGHGLAGKAQIQRMVASLLDIKALPKYSDVTDALALAIAHSYILSAAAR